MRNDNYMGAAWADPERKEYFRIWNTENTHCYEIISCEGGRLWTRYSGLLRHETRSIYETAKDIARMYGRELCEQVNFADVKRLPVLDHPYETAYCIEDEEGNEYAAGLSLASVCLTLQELVEDDVTPVITEEELTRILKEGAAYPAFNGNVYGKVYHIATHTVDRRNAVFRFVMAAGETEVAALPYIMAKQAIEEQGQNFEAVLSGRPIREENVITLMGRKTIPTVEFRKLE